MRIPTLSTGRIFFCRKKDFMQCNLNEKTKVLVLNGYNRNGLAIVRSLGSKNYVCDVTTKKLGFSFQIIACLLKSRYIRKVHFLRPYSDELTYLEALINLIRKEKYAYLVTAGTEASNFASKYKDQLSKYVLPLVEDYSKMWIVHNKAECMQWAASLGIPVPKTYYINSLEDLKKAAHAIDHPVVVKYPDSCASNGLWTFPRGGREFFDEYVRLVPEIVSGDRTDDYPIIQERIFGSLVDTTAFSVDGKTHAVLSQERLVTAWLDGGGGLVNVTNDIPAIKANSKRILQALQWTGHIEMDWICDSRTGNFLLLEINPKFWGTTQLTISSGFDYPMWLLQHAEGQAITPSGEYKTGLMYRWLFNELTAVLTVPHDKKRLLLELKLFFNRFSYKPCMIDVWPSDLKPSIKDFIMFLIKMFRSLFKVAKMLLR